MVMMAMTASLNASGLPFPISFSPHNYAQDRSPQAANFRSPYCCSTEAAADGLAQCGTFNSNALFVMTP
jgi:hypothetical protein